MSKTIISKRWALQWRDALTGCLMAFGTAALVPIQQSLDAGIFVFNWKQSAMAGVGAAIVYLTKNYLRKPRVIITSSSNKAVEAIGKKLP